MQRGIVYLLIAATISGCNTPGARTRAAAQPAVPPSQQAENAPRAESPGTAVARGGAQEIATRSSGSQVVLATSDESAGPATQAVVVEAQPAHPASELQGDKLALSLDQAIETGLAQNPDLVALRQTEGVSAAALGVAETYPFNPFVQVQATPIQHLNPGLSAATTFHYVLLMQTIQLAHQQSFREEGACAALNSVRWNVHQAELVNLAQTERLYFTAVYQRGIRNLTKLNADSNKQMLRVLERQLEAGQANAADVAIVRLDSRSTHQQAQLAEANYRTAVLDLQRQLNLPPGAAIEPAGDLLRWRWLPADDEHLAAFQAAAAAGARGEEGIDRGNIVASMAACRPDVLAARSDLDVANANRKLACASRTPDMQIGPYYQATVDGTFWGLRAQMDMPVINSGKPLVRQRDAELQQRTTAWQQLQTRAQLEAEAAIDRYERVRRLVAESEAGLKESLPAELQRLEEQFKAGEVDVLRVFQARTSLIQNRRANLDLLNELAQAAAAVTAATGLPPQALIAFDPESE